MYYMCTICMSYRLNVKIMTTTFVTKKHQFPNQKIVINHNLTSI